MGGETLVADALTVSGALVVDPSARVEGTLHFEKGSRICLMNWSGSTQQLVDEVLAGASWTSDEPLIVEIAGGMFTDGSYYYGFAGDSSLAELGERFGTYRVHEDGGYINMGVVVTVEKGVDIEVEDSLDGQLIFEGDNIVRAAEGYEAHFNAAASTVAHGTRFEIPVMYVENLSGENITFAAQVPFSVTVGEAYWTPENTGWDGAAASLQTAVTEALKGINGYTITAQGPLLGIETWALDKDLVISEEWLNDILPAGFAGLHFSNLECSGHTIRVASGATLDADNLYLSANASLIVERGAQLVDSVENDMDLSVGGDATSCGSLQMTGVDLNGAEIYAHGNVTLRECWGEGEIVFSWSYQLGKVSISDCDLSQMTLILQEPIGDEEASSTVFDLSGNYWGTTDMEEIKAMIQGYDPARFYIGEVLEASPVEPPAPEPPAFALLAPQLKESGRGRTSVTLSWVGSAELSYELYVDDKRVMSVKKTQWKGTMGDGTHRYTVIAVHADGSRSSLGGEVRCDATAPELVLHEPQITKQAGSSLVTLSWASNEDATYTVTVGKLQYYAGSDTSCTLELADGKYTYSVTAIDKTGHSSTEKDKLTLDSTPPKLELKKPTIRKKGNGQGQVTLSWKGESGATYTLTVDGEVVYTGSRTSHKFFLPDGTHSYKVVAVDKAANSSEQNGSFSLDTTAPALSLGEPVMSWAGEGKMNVTLNWEGEPGASYLLKVDGRKYELAGTSCTLSGIKDGKHSYELTASDAAGNKVTLKDSFSFDATAPRLSVRKPKVTKVDDGKINARFSWSGEKGARYTLQVGDKSYEVGTVTSYDIILDDGTQAYTITAVDAAGNTTVKGGSFSIDATAPVLSDASAGFLSERGGKVQASLSWRGEEGASYTVMVDGKRVYSGKTSLCTLKLTPGTHSYSITAKDKAGNESLALTGSIDTDSLMAGPGAALVQLDRELGLSAGSAALPGAAVLSAGLPQLCGAGLGADWQEAEGQKGSLASLG